MKNREYLDAQYQKLTTVEKFIVQLMSVIYEPCSKSTVARCLQECKAQISSSNVSLTAALGVILGKLQKLKLLNTKNQCHPLFVEIASRYAIRDCHFKIISDAVRKVLPVDSGPNHLYSYSRCIRDIRIALYNADLATLNKYLEKGMGQFPDSFAKTDPLIAICNNPFDTNWFKQLPMKLQNKALKNIISHSILCLDGNSGPTELLEEYVGSDKQELQVEFQDTLTSRLLFNSDLKTTQKLLKKNCDTCAGLSKQGWLSFLFGDYDAALDYFHLALQSMKKVSKKKKVTLDHFSSVFYILSTLRSEAVQEYDHLMDYINLIEKSDPILLSTFELLKAATLIKQNKVNEANSLIHAVEGNANDAISNLFLALVLFWLEPELAKFKINKLASLFTMAQKNGYTWIAYECAELLSRLDQADPKPYQTFAKSVQDRLGIHSIISLIQQEAPWQRSLNALKELSEAAENQLQQVRLAWLLKPEEKELVPLEQKLSTKGQWSKGRNIALSRLFEHDPSLDYLDEQDIAICSAIKKQSDASGSTRYFFEFERAIQLLAKHSFIFIQNDDQLIPIEVIKGEPELVIEQNGNAFKIELCPFINKEITCLWRETPTRYKIIKARKIHHEIANLLSAKGLTIPGDAKDQLVECITNISSLVMIQSDIGGIGKAVPRVSADPRIYVHLLPYSTGLKVELFVKPFTESGPYLKPAKGGKTLITHIEDQRVQTRRNFTLEKNNLQQVLEQCTTLSTINTKEYDIALTEPEACLNLLLELQGLGDAIVPEWPEGQKFKLRRQVTSKQINVEINKAKGNDWFDMNATVEIDEDTTVSLHALLNNLDDSHGRFVRIGDGEFISLTKELHKRLKDLKSYVELNDGDVRLHKLAAHTANDFINGLPNVKTDKNWKAHLQRIQTPSEPAVLPTELKADLRSYQVAGYQWLSQLADWGMGACLADDMGLGKTIQSLAIVLKRATAGPTLVVAPTSVCLNWLEEAARFAPDLTLHTLATRDRETLIQSLKAGDVLICSFGLLQQAIAALQVVSWSTIVIDEAQAIKNANTKRSQAALKLQAGFKLITTGTPIENHLTELWSLFEFINPGLLGSQAHFNYNFVQPIEKNIAAKRHQLKKLIQPFILRRLKSQVLKELPPRTEITLHVEMSAEEKLSYNTLRERALKNLSSDSNSEMSNNHLQILSEITKLRRFCCHPKLVANQEPTLESSKLNLFTEVVEELLSNNHKALIFSQFVSHLSLLREVLDRKKINYQYLDGATPALARKKSMNNFQNGQGDLFLISLKAGGSGLNLTEADYVIHMDPWWNPAVEDQASDRAHRIGQKRPVTIYRLIVKDSIEEKIVALHHKKRDLANSLLSGAETSAKLSAKELLDLIRDPIV